jgi:cation diffusion facilitator family transporter
MDPGHSHDHGDDGHHYDHNHAGRDSQGHGHTHGVIDPSIASTERGVWAVKWSFIGLTVTALLQAVVVFFSGSVALLADTIHNLGDASTAIPLGIAFLLARRGVTRRFTYGLGRVEDFAGLVIVATILLSAVIACYEAVQRLVHPQTVVLLWAVMLASVTGFVGNEAVAIFRIRVGRQIGSVALVADGYHARVDGWTSLAVLVGAVGVGSGYPLADPIVGLLISVAIFVLVWQSARSVIVRMLDGVDSGTLEAISHAASHVPRVEEVTDVRARWIGHRLHAELSVTVARDLSVGEGHEVSREVRHQLLHHVPHLGGVVVHVDPVGQGGERHHRIGEHAHDGLPVHVHD